jgi:hypothetical protein
MKKQEKVEKNKKYIIVINSGDQNLTYTANNLDSSDSVFIRFIDKFGSIMAINKNSIISMKEVL